ncbi:hypothetical protein SZ25_00384, partial [Candidatus Arcanobacter lacustris]
MIKLDPKITKHFKGYNNSAKMIMTCLYF